MKPKLRLCLRLLFLIMKVLLTVPNILKASTKLSSVIVLLMPWMKTFLGSIRHRGSLVLLASHMYRAFPLMEWPPGTAIILS